MSSVTVNEFCADVAAMLARIALGDVIEVTRGGEVIAVARPPVEAETVSQDS